MNTFPRSLFDMMNNVTFEMENNKMCDYGVQIDFSPQPVPRNRTSSLESSSSSLGSPKGSRRLRFASTTMTTTTTTTENDERRRSSILSSRYKTELCRPFAEAGACKYGDKCQFAHGLLELRPLVRHPKYKTELCRTFHAIGFCPYGPRCHFVHNPEERQAKTSPPSTPSTPSGCGGGGSKPFAFQQQPSSPPASPVLMTTPPKPMRRSVSQVQFNPRFSVDEIEQNMLRFNYDRRALEDWKRELAVLADLDQLILSESRPPPLVVAPPIEPSFPPPPPPPPLPQSSPVEEAATVPPTDPWNYASCSSSAGEGGSPRRLPVFSSLA